ncbi:MAG: hypothetical protein ACTHYC_02025 [Sphingobacterium sp.]
MKELSYFRTRPRFGKSHPYDIGMPFFWWKGHYDVHFLNSLYQRDENEFADFYAYHLEYFKETNADVTESEFFNHVRDIVKDELKNLIAHDKRSSKEKHRLIVQHKIHLRAFLGYLDTVDLWQSDRTKEEIITAKESEIVQLRETVTELKRQLRELKKLDTDDYINIPKGYLLTAADLLTKLQKLKTPEDKELAFSIHSSVWVKMLCRHFRHDNKPISPETLRRYFPADRNEMGSKYAEIPGKYRLFDIVPAKKRS